MLANIYTCFLPQIVFSTTFTGPDQAMAIFHSPDLLYIICGNGHFSQAVNDSSFLFWPEASLQSIIKESPILVFSSTLVARITFKWLPLTQIKSPLARILSPQSPLAGSLTLSQRGGDCLCATCAV